MQESFTVLPLRFGMAFKDREEVVGLLGDKYEEIEGYLRKVKGRMELGLRLFWYHESFLEGKLSVNQVEKPGGGVA